MCDPQQEQEPQLVLADDGAMALYEVFRALRRGGFTVPEAAAVIAAVFRAS